MSLLEMKHIKKEFGGMPVIRDISLSVEQGEILAIIGRPVPASLRCSAVRRCWRRLMTVRFCIWEKERHGWKMENPLFRKSRR